MVVVGPRSTIFHAVPPNHVLVQTAKLATALVTGIYSQKNTNIINKTFNYYWRPACSNRSLARIMSIFPPDNNKMRHNFAILFGTIGSRRTSAQGTFQDDPNVVVVRTNVNLILSILPFVVLCHRNALRLYRRSQGQVRFTNANNATTGNHLECAHSHGIGHQNTAIGVVGIVGVIVRIARGWCGGYYCHYYGKCYDYTTSTTTTTTTAKEGPDPKRHKITTECEEGESTSTATAAAAVETTPIETTTTSTSTSPMEMETPLAIMGTAAANEAASSSAMDTGSNSTAATAATATTTTTATMALTDDEEEGPINNSNYNNKNNNNSSTKGPNSNQDGSASASLSKRGTAASSNSSSTTTTKHNKNKNNNKTGAAATSSQPPPAVPLPQISLVTCLDQWAAEHVVDDVRWPHLGPQAPRHAALRTIKLVNFPPYLILQMQRYRWGDDG